MWVLYSSQTAIVVNIILAIFLILFFKNGMEIYNSLAVKDEEAVSGKFTNFAQYENMNELDNNNIAMGGGNLDRLSG
jgi:hypothetical protein